MERLELRGNMLAVVGAGDLGPDSQKDTINFILKLL